MDQPQSTQPSQGAGISLTPDMRPVGGAPTPPREAAARPARQKDAPRTANRLSALAATLSLALALGAVAGAGWTYVESQREILRLSTELAELKVSLDLYARNSPGGAVDLTDLTSRLSTLEQNWRGNAVPMPETATAAPPALATPRGASGEDCLPVGMRLLVAAGDSYPICDQAASVAIGFVDNGYITLDDGTSVASGGTMPLPGSPCTIAVTSGGDEGLTGYAEIRVSC